MADLDQRRTVVHQGRSLARSPSPAPLRRLATTGCRGNPAADRVWAETLVNLAAALSGRAAVNLNFTAGKAAMTSAASQAGLRTAGHQPALRSRKPKLEIPEGVETIWIEDVRAEDQPTSIACRASCWPCWRQSGCSSESPERRDGSRSRTPSPSSSAAAAKANPRERFFTHFNIDSEIEAIGQVFHIYPNDRILDVLPLFHSFGYTASIGWP